MSKHYSIGVDFGSNSVRALLVDVNDGREIGVAVYHYPSGTNGILLDKNNPLLARQNPADYIEGVHKVIAEAVSSAKENDREFSATQVAGIGVDTTGSTPIPVDKDGTALALLPQFTDELAAHAWLWKDHTSHEAAEIITQKAKEHAISGGPDYLAKCGGRYSSEWFWSKIWHCKKENPRVFAAAASWVELADFIPAYLTGNTHPARLARGICGAGHKALYNESWGGLPSADFLNSLDPDLVKIRDNFAASTKTSDQVTGYLTASSAEACGLPSGIPVAVGACDAHMGAVGAGIKKGTLVKIMGTSTCDIMVHPLGESLPNIPGLCGIVPGSVLPDMYGLEAGQSAVGDLFHWFVKHLTSDKMSFADLSERAAKLKPGESGLVALDWNNGNRTILANPMLSGLLIGQTLHTSAAEIYRALIEATAFGALTIINRFEEYGVPVREIINCGGIAEKDPLVMQIYADVCNRPMKVSRSAQTCALGAAIFGAVAGGIYQDIPSAQARMTGVKETIYQPDSKSVETYRQLYRIYKNLHDAFGGQNKSADLGNIMPELIRIRQEVKK